MAVDIPSEALTEGLPPNASNTTVSAVSIALLIVSVVFAIAGQLTLKSAMREVGRIGAREVSDAGQTLKRAAKEPRLWFGLFLFGVSALFWLVVLSRVPLSVAYPFVGISYILIVAFARYFLHEHVPLLRWIGVAVVALGIAIVGLSFKRATGA
ncbi:MAG TPA: EamA family transporter [Actinomycetota bacterium]|nr:EamA family transporter [Actinomycetota bacterium]